MFKLINVLLLFILFSYSNSIFAQTTNWKTFNYDSFIIEHPLGWDNSVGRAGTEFMLYAPLDNDEDLFLEAIALRIMEASGDLNNQVLDFQVYLLGQGYEVLTNERKNNNDREFHFMEYKGLQGTQELYHLQYQWVIDGTDVQLSFLGEADKISQYRDLVLKIMDTFRTKD